MKALTDETFGNILASTPLMVVDFWADWCAPCRALAMRLENVEKLFGDNILFASVDAVENTGLSQDYKIRNLPTLILFKDGEVTDRLTGLVTEQVIKDRIEQMMEG